MTDKELQIFKELFSYGNPNELWNALMDADKEKYVELLNALKIKQNVLNKQIDKKTGIERERLVSLVNTVENIFDSLKENKPMYDSEIPDLEREESAKKK